MPNGGSSASGKYSKMQLLVKVNLLCVYGKKVVKINLLYVYGIYCITRHCAAARLDYIYGKIYLLLVKIYLPYVAAPPGVQRLGGNIFTMFI